MSDQYNYWTPELPIGHPMYATEEGLCKSLCNQLDEEARQCDPDYEALMWLRHMYSLEAWIKKAAAEAYLGGIDFDTLKLVRIKDDE